MLISELGNSGVVYLPPKTPRYSIYVFPLYSPILSGIFSDVPRAVPGGSVGHPETLEGTAWQAKDDVRKLLVP